MRCLSIQVVTVVPISKGGILKKGLLLWSRDAGAADGQKSQKNEILKTLMEKHPTKS